MRCFTIAAVVAVSTVALTQIASAADLPRKAPAYIPLSPPILSWTGWYAGLNAGGMWSNQDVDTGFDQYSCGSRSQSRQRTRCRSSRVDEHPHEFQRLHRWWPDRLQLAVHAAVGRGP
jgi:opacity protein-like surface antigen